MPDPEITPIPPGKPHLPPPQNPPPQPADDEDEPDEYTNEDVKNYQKRHGI